MESWGATACYRYEDTLEKPDRYAEMVYLKNAPFYRHSVQGSSIKHVGSFLMIFDPGPSPFVEKSTLLVNVIYVCPLAPSGDDT